MKKIFLTFVFVLVATSIQAQDLKWENDINKAVAESIKTKKPMLLFFTGSDWCGWCVRLQKEVLKTSEFGNWASKNVVLVELDFPRSVAQTEKTKMQNAKLQQEFQIQGFPTICFANATLNKKKEVTYTKLGNSGYVAGGPKAWLAVADGILKKK